MFTPVETTIGALLLQQATSNLLFQNGNILGASGLIRQLFSSPTRETLAFFAGMVLSYLPMKALAPQLITSYPAASTTLPTAIVTIGAAVLSGWGTKMANGCTSGHMLCGLPRLSGRSAAATAVFIPVAMITHHFMHPAFNNESCPGDLPCYTPVIPPVTATAKLVVLAIISVLPARMVPHLIFDANQANAVQVSSSNKEHKASSGDLARIASRFFSGLLFALGLQISQMSHPDKVTSFLSFPVWKYWDPSLLLIIVFAVLPNLVEIQSKGLTTPPSFANKFSVPTKTFKDVDRRFVAGAAAFGVAWGLTGICPGPAVLKALVQPTWGAMWLGGFWLGGHIPI